MTLAHLQWYNILNLSLALIYDTAIIEKSSLPKQVYS